MNEFFHHYVEILSDPAHLAVEVTLMLLVDGVFLGLVWPFVRAHIHRDIAAEHATIDAEHGITHEQGPLAPVIPLRPESPAPYDYAVSGF